MLTYYLIERARPGDPQRQARRRSSIKTTADLTPLATITLSSLLSSQYQTNTHDGEHALLQHTRRRLPDHPRLRPPPITTRLNVVDLDYIDCSRDRTMGLPERFPPQAVEELRTGSTTTSATLGMHSESERSRPPASSAVGSVSRPAGSSTGSSTAAAAAARRKNYSIGSGKQITRTRVSYSCHTCRRRKVKCDKVCSSNRF